MSSAAVATPPGNSLWQQARWITGIHLLMLDPDDPWPGGYRLSDTWPLRQ